MARIDPPCYRICIWRDGSWRPHCTRTREPMKVVRSLLDLGWDRRQIVVERRPGKLIPMPLPTDPGPVVMAGKVVGIVSPRPGA